MSKSRAVGYVRVSSVKQSEEGVSLDAQREKVRQWAALNGAELQGIETDGGKSGGRMSNRPGLKRALDEACCENGVLVVYSLSRMARSVADACAILERLRKSGADFVSLSESIDTRSAAGRALFGMLAVFAAFEREIAGERTAAALAHLRKSGRRYSRLLPFGFRLAQDGATLEQDEAEQRAIARAKGLKLRGYSVARIEAVLSDEGFRRGDGSPIGTKAIRRALAA